MSSLPRLRVIGLAAGLTVLAAGAGFFVFSRGQESSNAASVHPVVSLSKRTTPHPVKPPPVKPPPAVPKKTPKPVVKPKPKPVQQDDRLPLVITDALRRHEIVVVSLFAPRIELDDVATREARAGATQAGAGFVALNVLSEAQAKPLIQQLGVLDSPTVLVFRRPDALVVTLSGFADQQTVAQAARNASL